MNTISRTIGTTNYVIVNQSYGTRSGFAHRSTLIRNGLQVNEERVYYLNRTWESYQFRTSMMVVIERLIDREAEEAIADYKEETGRKRLTKEEKAEIVGRSDLIIELQALKDTL